MKELPIQIRFQTGSLIACNGLRRSYNGANLARLVSNERGERRAAMIRAYLLAAAAVFLFGAIRAQSQQRHFGLPFLVKVSGKYGFMDGNCQMTIPARYSQAFDFTEGLAAVKIDGKWGHVNQAGALVIPAAFDGAFHFSDGLASVKPDAHSPLWGFIDRAGKLVIPPQFGMPLWFSEGLVEGYGERNGVLNVPLGYVDKTGRYSIHLDEPGMEVEFLVGFSEGLARVSMRPRHPDGSVGPSSWGYIDHSGKWVLPRSFGAADDFHEGLAAVEEENGLWGYINKTGQFIIPPRFEAAKEFSEGLAAVALAGRWNWIDKSGRVAIVPQFEAEDVGIFRDGVAMIIHSRRLGYMNIKGEIFVPPTLQWGTEFVEEVAAVSDGSAYQVIRRNGQVECRLEAK
ncbi:MAG TPA: WG repeat-containing protein [Terriglobales bacterium]|nr:WG repeat-containing protein [Terriglobales bacterium]